MTINKSFLMVEAHLEGGRGAAVVSSVMEACVCVCDWIEKETITLLLLWR